MTTKTKPLKPKPQGTELLPSIPCQFSPGDSMRYIGANIHIKAHCQRPMRFHRAIQGGFGACEFEDGRLTTWIKLDELEKAE